MCIYEICLYSSELLVMHLSESVVVETFYWFGDNNHTEWEELFREYIPPPYRIPNLKGAYSFGVAGKCVTIFSLLEYLSKLGSKMLDKGWLVGCFED